MALKTGVIAAENSVLHHRNKLHFKIYSNRKQSFLNYNTILNFYSFYCVLDQINEARIDLFQNLNTSFHPKLFKNSADL